MHRALLSRGVSITERSVTPLMQRYEELVTLRITDRERVKTQLQKQGHVILALDGVPPDVGHEVHRARPGLSFGSNLTGTSLAQ